MTEREAKQETWKHIRTVRDMMHKVLLHLLERGLCHDQSKLEHPEFEIFRKYTPKLKDSTYGSDEYKTFLKEMKPALDHHYATNRHHPEHFEHGINEMDLFDLIEMFVDWNSATKRHADGDIGRSIKVNTKRFGISEQLVLILENTAKTTKGWEEED